MSRATPCTLAHPQATAMGYSVNLDSCLESDVMAVCNALKHILASVNSTHSVSRAPIFCVNMIQMAQLLLQCAYDNDTAQEIVHVLPGSHDICFKIHLEHAGHHTACYRITFRCKHKKTLLDDQDTRRFACTMKPGPVDHASTCGLKRSRDSAAALHLGDATDEAAAAACSGTDPLRGACKKVGKSGA